ncbi:hypothetical protein AAY473_002854 [Plecturocebus cupreus]
MPSSHPVKSHFWASPGPRRLLQPHQPRVGFKQQHSPLHMLWQVSVVSMQLLQKALAFLSLAKSLLSPPCACDRALC